MNSSPSKESREFLNRNIRKILLSLQKNIDSREIQNKKNCANTLPQILYRREDRRKSKHAAAIRERYMADETCNGSRGRATRKHNRIRERAATNEDALERVACTALSTSSPHLATPTGPHPAMTIWRALAGAQLLTAIGWAPLLLGSRLADTYIHTRA